MRPEDMPLAAELKRKLREFSEDNHPLPGIETQAAMDCLINQLVDSIKRVKYVELIRDKNISQGVIDPQNNAFDPVKAASWHRTNSNIDEACWLLFLSIHFGKHLTDKWKLTRAIYGKLGASPFWTWNNVSQNIQGFLQWLNENHDDVKASGKFGNHRKYENLVAYGGNVGTGATIASYINWIMSEGGHVQFFNRILHENDGDARSSFNTLYNAMNQVVRFGRTGKFDYLTMIGKMGIVAIEPGSTYMQGATGPYDGASILFGATNRRTLNNRLNELEEHLDIFFGMQVLEDAICNWQKNTTTYQYFGG